MLESEKNQSKKGDIFGNLETFNWALNGLIFNKIYETDVLPAVRVNLSYHQGEPTCAFFSYPRKTPYFIHTDDKGGTLVMTDCSMILDFNLGVDSFKKELNQIIDFFLSTGRITRETPQNKVNSAEKSAISENGSFDDLFGGSPIDLERSNLKR